MTTHKSGLAYRRLSLLLAGAMLWTLCLAEGVHAQRPSRTAAAAAQTISAGTTIAVRTTEPIDAKDADGLIFPAVVDKAVLDRSGRVAIPAGADVQLIVREISNNEMALDLDAVTINNQRYSIAAEDSIATSEQKDGIGANGRTGKYVGGGALLGAVIGAIAGGGKGAAIGAGAGAAAGAGTQVLTKGRRVSVPAESLLTFRLQEPLQTGFADNTFMRDGRRYSGRYAAASGRNINTYANANTNIPNVSPNIHINGNNTVIWQAPSTARVFVQVDNEPRKLFAEGQSGTQAASWISDGHQYVFTLVDSSGREIGRDQMDLRARSNGRRR